MNHRHHASSVRGFTITEAVVASAILAMSVIAVYEGLVLGYSSSRRASLEVMANIEGVRRLETVMATSFENIVPYSSSTDTSGRAFAMYVTPLSNVDNNAVLVTLDVSWSFQNKWKKRSFTMVKAAESDQFSISNKYLMN